MGKDEKIIQRFCSKPKDFTFDELSRLMKIFGYNLEQGSGSRVIFSNSETRHKIKLHQPHPTKILKRYQLDLVEDELKTKGLL